MKVVNAIRKLKQNFTKHFIHKTAKFSVILLLILHRFQINLKLWLILSLRRDFQYAREIIIWKGEIIIVQYQYSFSSQL